MTETDYDIVARTLYGEARGEYRATGVIAFIAIANVIMNRIKAARAPQPTPAQICLKSRQFSCWNRGDPNRSLIQGETLERDPLFQLSLRVAKKVLEGMWPDLTRGADHYHAFCIKPYWAKADKIRIRLGNHIFYKLSKG